jgi:type I restriction enzyme S subunit
MNKDWINYQLGELVHVKHGFAFKGEHFSTGEATPDVLVTPGNFAIGGGFKEDNLKYYRGPVPEDYVLQPGDLIITMTDLSKAGDTLGYPAIVPSAITRRYLHNQRIGLVTVTQPTLLDLRYLFYRLRAADYRHRILATASGSTVRHTSPSRIQEFRIALPPLDEQRGIAGVLGALDDKIDMNRRTSRTLEKLARAIFRAWFVDFEPVKTKAAGARSFPGMPQKAFNALPTRIVPSELGPIPDGWSVGPISDAVSVRGGGTPSTKVEEYWEGGTHCWLTPKDLSGMKDPILLSTDRKITDKGLDKISSGLLPVGTVLLSSRAPVGYLVLSAVPTAINQGFIAMVCDGPLPPLFIFHWTQSVMEEIKSRASGTTFPEISKTAFRPMKVCVPPKPILDSFVAVVAPLFDGLTASIKETRLLANMRDYLLPKLLSGAVVVAGVDDGK